jgi:hypothetical protein
MGSGIAIIGFVSGDGVSIVGSAPFPSAFAKQGIEELGCFLGLEKGWLVIDFRAGDRDEFHRFLTPDEVVTRRAVGFSPMNQPLHFLILAARCNLRGFHVPDESRMVVGSLGRL